MQSAGRFRASTLLAALIVTGACHRPSQEEVSLMTGACSSRVRSKGVTPRLPAAPSLRSGYGGVVGTLADAGGALPHYSVMATVPRGGPGAPHATVTADSAGGFVFNSLTPGPYRVSVRIFSHKPDSADVEVSAGKVDTVQLRPPYYECVR